MATIYRVFPEKLGGTSASTFVGNQGDLFYDPTSSTLRMSDGSTAGGVVVGGGATATGFIKTNANNPTWTGTAGYTVTKSGGDGSSTDAIYSLFFPTPYSARTDYIVHSTYDGTDWTVGNDAQIGTNRYTDRIDFIIRRLDSSPLNIGDIMVTIHNL